MNGAYLQVPCRSELRTIEPDSSSRVAGKPTLVYQEDLPEYFSENVLHGVRTAYDSMIWQAVVAMRPEWKTKYAEIGEIISGTDNLPSRRDLRYY